MTVEEMRKVQEFINSGKVTKCPATGDPSLADYHRKQNENYGAWRRPGRPKTALTPAQKKERQREICRAYYQKNKAIFHAKAKARWAAEKARRQEEKQ